MLREDELLRDPAEAEATAAGRDRVDRTRAERRKRQEDERQALAAEEVTLDKFFLNPLQKRLEGIDLRESIVGEPMVSRTIEGASSISLPVSDPHRKLLRSDLLAADREGERLRENIDVNVDGLWFRLDGCGGSVGHTLELIFIARPVAQIRALTAPFKARREDAQYRGLTRAEAARQLVRAVPGKPIGFVSPELHKRQPERESEGAASSGGASGNRKGRQQTTLDRLNKRFPYHTLGDLSGHYQMSVDEVRLVCEVVGFTPTQAMQMAQIARGESIRYPGIVASDRGIGLFQITSWTFGAEGKKWVSDLGGNAEMRNPVKNAIVALKLFKERGFAPWFGTQYLNRSLSGVKSILGEDVDLGDLSGQRGGPQVTTEQPYEFTVGPPEGPRGENYWETLARWADDVHWRCFEVNGRIHFVAEDDLFAADAKATIKPTSPGIEDIDIIDWLPGRRVKEVRVQARIGRWATPPGKPIEFAECGPLDGKWLVTTIERPIFSSLATITVRKPQRPKLEPPNEVETQQLPGPGQDASGGGAGADPGAGRRGPTSDFSGNNFIWPTGVHTIVGAFGTNRGDHIHEGIDIGVTVGSNVRAVEAGSCAILSDPGGYGTYMVVQHGNGWESRYAHLSRTIAGNGQKVAKGEIIAKSGGAVGAPGAGNSQGPHLHFEIRHPSSRPLNPVNLLP